MARPAYFVVLAIFVAVRVICWSGTDVLDDHDSVTYIADASAWRSLEIGRIAQINPDSAPLYPVAAAVAGSPGWSMEFAARLASLAFSLATCVLVYGIGCRIGSSAAVLAGLLLFALDPPLVQLGVAIVSEPAYLAATYLGLWWFWRQVDRPTPSAALLCGVFFSLTFLARTEGLLFVAAVPVLQIAHALFVRDRRYTARTLAAWCALFVLGFSVPASLQVLDVSRKMGQFAINGREVWQDLLNRPDIPSNDAAIYGLDYSPSQVNLHYVREHPEVAAEIGGRVGPRRYVGLVKRNVLSLVRTTLGELFGWVLLPFAAGGVLVLAFERRFYDAFLAVAFCGACLVGPLLHSVPVDHVAVVAPLVMLLAGIGVVWAANALRARIGTLAVVLVATPLLPWLPSLYAVLVDPPARNLEYSPASIRRMAETVDSLSAESSGVLRVMSRKSYVTYYSEDVDWVTLPFTDYDGLMRYARSNDVDLVFLEREIVRKFPFVEAFDSQDVPDLTLIRAMDDERGRRLELWECRTCS